MIVDARALDVEAVPSEILRRNNELNALSNALEPLLDGYRGEHSIVVGPSGAGKTACARYTVEQLRRSLVDVRAQYINCWQHSSRFAALLQLVDGIGQSMDIQQHSTPHDELLRRLRNVDDRPYIVILDEADQLDCREDILYELTTLDHVYMILICNRERELLDGLDRRVVSRLRGCRRIEFEAYSTATLVDILDRRAEVGLEAGSLTDGVLREIAEVSNGDARVAIRTLAEAAKQAERDSTSIKSDYVDEAVSEAEENIRQKAISQLNRHQRVIYDVLEEDGGWLPMGELYPEYSERVDEARTKTTVSNYLSKIAEYNLVELKGEKRGRRYRAI
ncbi:Orc1-type DNA replication protein [Natronomonas pharaonis DSM 2160]|uniref:Orc1-type DNA replication protein n=1 Tax=Natronomonas pharaonis (strain ATCC 35678 / DSM 2160 / CIP 103997 / JCM 8858 / NBRC 14720 / NCIMB 2260 / Gabara) TaxID=348780 RepID=A0A1U7EX59_NATPD|nr:Cdc6/Cdc18 family protein [Natronomonas pharaonis]CAI49720.1 Orc1-type DNA replication protein [Natronomonas pharaonis DSM 2160]